MAPMGDPPTEDAKREAREQAAKLLKRGWSRVCMAMTRTGRPCEILDSNAVAWCAQGALLKACVNPHNERADIDLYRATIMDVFDDLRRLHPGVAERENDDFNRLWLFNESAENVDDVVELMRSRS